MDYWVVGGCWPVIQSFNKQTAAIDINVFTFKNSKWTHFKDEVMKWMHIRPEVTIYKCNLKSN